MTLRYILLPSILCIVTALQAQTDNEALYLNKKTTLEIDVVSNALKISEHHVSEKVFYKNFDRHSRESVFYSDFDPVTDFEASTVLPGNKKMKVTTIETRDIVQPGIFYGGVKRKDFVFPGLMEGAVGRLEFKKDITEARLLTPFYFSEDVTIRQAEFSVIFPQDASIKYKVFCDSHNNIKFEQQALRNKIKYSWTFNDVPAYKKEENSPSRPYSTPHVVVYVDSYQSKGQKVKVLSDVSDLYKWYADLVKRIPVTGNADELKAEVKTLTSGLTTDKEKVKAIFQWVQTNIKYIAFEDGMAGFIPRAAYDVYTKRYGDCKDMANLLKYMINAAGVNAYLTWIGTRQKPYSYADVPTAISDDHMICSVKLDGEFVFLDATNSYVMFGTPSSMIQGKEALIGIDDRQFEIVKVPVVDVKHNQRTDTVQLSLENNGVRGTLKSHLTGYRKDDLEVAHLSAGFNHDPDFVRDFFKIGKDDIVIEKPTFNGLGDLNRHGVVDFNFFQPAYFKRSGDKIYFNLNVNKSLPGEKVDRKTREQIIEMDYCYEDRSVTRFKIPENHTASFLPVSIKKEWPEFGFDFVYIQEGDHIVLHKLVYVNFLYLDTSKFEQWNQFIDHLTSANAQTVILSKIN